MNDLNHLLILIQRLHSLIRDDVINAFENNASEKMAEVARDDEGDTIFAIDVISEKVLLDYFKKEIAPSFSLVLIAEGLPGGKILLPEGISEKEATWRIIMDPIDGTRVLMYQKRSAWILTGIAPNLGPETNLQDIQLAVQTEIPLLKQHLSDNFWAIKGQGAQANRYNRLTGELTPFNPQPSNANSIAQGFAMISRYFPGAREVLAEIDEEIVQGALGPVQFGKTHCFEDQYISDGGRLYELMVGHDRFVADLRPLLDKVLNERDQALGICCHPYDICTELIAREMGVIITDVYGEDLTLPLDVESDVAWIGYANQDIRVQIELLLTKALKKRRLI